MRRAQVGMEDGRVPGEIVASVGVQDDPRSSACRRESAQKRGEAAAALATTHAQGDETTTSEGQLGVLGGGGEDECV